VVVREGQKCDDEIENDDSHKYLSLETNTFRCISHSCKLALRVVAREGLDRFKMRWTGLFSEYIKNSTTHVLLWDCYSGKERGE